jgi:hypothetical protein
MERYKKFIEEEHKCECGCGLILKPTYSAFYKTIIRQNIPPKYIKGHYRNIHHKKRVEDDRYSEPIELNGCRVMLVKYPRRCEKSYRCEKYKDCLLFVIKAGAEGWKIVE